MEPQFERKVTNTRRRERGSGPVFISSTRNHGHIFQGSGVDAELLKKYTTKPSTHQGN